MISLDAYRAQWFGNIRADVLAGLVVALALIPEAIAFSIIAGVDPKVGLYASFSIAVLIAFVGGRPGMISAATAATAVLMVTLVRDHGLQYLLAATVLAGLIQIGAGLLKLGFVMRYVSKSVMTGFVNALAILIFMAQLPELDPTKVTWLTYALVAVGLAIIYLFPYVTKAIPSPLVTILVLTGLTLAFGWDVRTVGDMGALPDTLPVFLIPMPALVAIMIMVSIGTFSWSSIRNLRLHPRSSSIVMIATVVTVVYTHNLAIGVLVGVLLSGIFFAGKIAQLFKVTSAISKDGRERTYIVEGQLFYGSVEDFMNAFDFREALDRVVIDVSAAHIWDISSVQALDMAVLKFRRDGAEVEIVGMNAATETIVDKLATHDKPGAMDKLMAH
jgi:MFS superfamily sulfate permease-like transporter